ncbi:MAG: dockerin type I domain-containing protein, partial [Planctomycetota bacterium]
GWYPIRLEHFQQNGTAVIELRFEGPGQSKTIIPSTHLLTRLPAAPKVESVQYDAGSNQRSLIRSITIDFDAQVIVDAGSFVLTTQSGSQVALNDPVLTLVDGKTRAVLTFSGDHVDGTGSLADGSYRLSVLSTRVRDSFGNALDGDDDGVAGGNLVDDFFKLYGDVDGNGVVDRRDFAFMRQAFGRSSDDELFNAAFDWDNDGVVDRRDFAFFRSNYGRRMG